MRRVKKKICAQIEFRKKHQEIIKDQLAVRGVY